MTKVYNAYLDHRPFVRYDAQGRVWAIGSQGLGFTMDEAARGELSVVGGNGISEDLEKFWVDTSSGAPVVRVREKFLPVPDRTSLPINEEFTIPGVPSATVTYTGPVSETLTHEGPADFELGWTVPGTYTVTLEAFPFRPATYTIEVTP